MTSKVVPTEQAEMEPPMPSGKHRHQGGFTYLLLLASIAIIAMAAAYSVQIGSELSRKSAEQALLFVGSEFERAFRSYALQSSQGPRTLEELLKDPRTPGTRRHLRQIYADPLTGQPNWGLVTDQAGFLTGVYSLAKGQPIQQTGFKPHRTHFENAESYSAWVFGLPSAQPFASSQTIQQPLPAN